MCRLFKIISFGADGLAGWLPLPVFNKLRQGQNIQLFNRCRYWDVIVGVIYPATKP